MLTRREFLGAGLGAAVAARAVALPGDKMRYAMSGHQFRTTPPHPETGIKMAARYGYHGLEPFQDDMPQYLEAAARRLQAGARRVRSRAVHDRQRRASTWTADCRRRSRATRLAPATSRTSAAGI